MARISSSRMTRWSTLSSFTSVPAYLLKSTSVARLYGHGDAFALFVKFARTNGNNLALRWFFLGCIGDIKTTGSFFLRIPDVLQEHDR